MRHPLTFAAFALMWLSPALVRAADLELDHLAPGAIKLDGKNKEWPGTTSADVTVKAGKLKATFNAGYDETGVWIGADIDKAGSIARTASFADNEDRITLTLAFPKSGGSPGKPEYASYEVAIYAGVPGSSEGLVKMRSPATGAIAGAKVIEAPRKPGGYTLEAFIPWSAFPEAKKTRAGLRGSLRAYDGDGSSIRAIKATSLGAVDDPASLGWFLIEPEQSLPQSFASRKLTWKDVKYDVTADLAGDGTSERALLVGKALYVLGPTYKQGKQWLTMDLDADVVSLDVKDVTGDGHAELLVTARIKPGPTTREALHVYTFSGEKGAEKPQKIFSHETRIDGGGGKLLEDKISFGSKKLTITYASPKGWDGASWDQPMANDLDPILLPWGTVKERTFLFSGGTFVKDKDVAQKGTALPPPTGTTTTTNTVTAPPLPKGDPAALALAQFRKDKGLGADAKTSFETVVTIGAGKKGRAALFGRDLVVTTDSGSYAFVTMTRFSTEKDVQAVSAQDLTGDGREEIIVRGLLRAKLTGGSGGDQEVVREVILIYAPKVSGSSVSLQPVFAVEVGRSIGDKRVDTSLKLVPAKGTTAGKIELTKGTAKGWTSTTY
ncbi:MAG: hypothetical protein ABI175_20150, partial [Polyangiales bacterium]